MPEDECLIEAEPMFCFETAVKLLYWSGFVYEDDEVTSQTDVCLIDNNKNCSQAFQLIVLARCLLGVPKP